MTRLKVVAMHPPAVKYKLEHVHLIRKNCCWAQAPSLILPHELFTIASTIAELVDVTVYDPALSQHGYDDIRNVLTNAEPDYVIVHYGYFDGRERPLIELLEQLKIKTILISSPIYYADEIAQMFPFADFVVDQDPEVSIYKYFHTKLELPPDKNQIRSFSDLPPIDWQLFTNPELLHKYAVVYEINRGCAYKCQFCLLGTLPYQWRPPEIVIDDLYRLSQLRNVTQVEFECSQITTDLKWIKRFCALKDQHELNFYFNSAVKANEITDEKIKLLSEAGMVSAYMGIDSLNPHVMDTLGKRVTVKQLDNAIKIMNKYNIDLACSTMFNIGETDEDVDAMLDMIKQVTLPRTRSGTVNVYKNTPLWHEHKHNLIPKPVDPDYAYNDKLLTLPDYENAIERQERFKIEMEKIFSDQLKSMDINETNANKRITLKFKGFDKEEDVRKR